jgi:hypothetical protein
VTLSALMVLFKARDPRIETLMVVGYNPSHSNINSDVNAPFKMLSLFMRFLENESKPTNMRAAIAPPVDYDQDSEEEEQKRPLGSLAGGGYSMMRKEELGVTSGERMDTMGGGDEYDENGDLIAGAYGDINEDDRLEVNMDDMKSDDDDSDDMIDLGSETPKKKEKAASEEQKTEETPENHPEGTNTSIGGNSSGDSTGSSEKKDPGNLFAVGESKDKGLADMETGSEVYMSELLVS